MCFRHAGLHFLYGEALASLRKEAVSNGTRYEITIDATTDDIDELNEVWQLDTEVIASLKLETGNRRVVIMPNPVIAETPTVEPAFTDVPTAVTVSELSPSPFGVGCRDQDALGLKTNLVNPLNPVLKEAIVLQKFPLRAGTRQRNTACPQYLHSLHSTIQSSATPYGCIPSATTVHPKASSSQTNHRQESRRTGMGQRYRNSRSGSRSTPTDTGGDTQACPATSPSHADARQSPRVQSHATLISLSVDGVIHYDSTT